MEGENGEKMEEEEEGDMCGEEMEEGDTAGEKTEGCARKNPIFGLMESCTLY